MLVNFNKMPSDDWKVYIRLKKSEGIKKKKINIR